MAGARGLLNCRHLRVFFQRMFIALEAMRSAEGHLHRKQVLLSCIVFGEKIRPLMQSYPINGQTRARPFKNVARNRFRSDGPIAQSRDFCIQIAMVEFLQERSNAGGQFTLPNESSSVALRSIVRLRIFMSMTAR